MSKSMTESGTTNLSIRMDKELKHQAEQLFSEMGMNITTAFMVFVKQALREGGIPFNINVNTSAEAHRRFIAEELEKAEREAQSPNAIWHDEDAVNKMLEEMP